MALGIRWRQVSQTAENRREKQISVYHFSILIFHRDARHSSKGTESGKLSARDIACVSIAMKNEK